MRGNPQAVLLHVVPHPVEVLRHWKKGSLKVSFLTRDKSAKTRLAKISLIDRGEGRIRIDLSTNSLTSGVNTGEVCKTKYNIKLTQGIRELEVSLITFFCASRAPGDDAAELPPPGAQVEAVEGAARVALKYNIFSFFL